MVNSLIFDIWWTLYSGKETIYKWLRILSTLPFLKNYETDFIYSLYENICQNYPILFWDIVFWEKDHFKLLLERLEINLNIDYVYNIYRKFIEENIVLFPYVKETLLLLKNNWYRLYIFSNGRTLNQIRKLELFDILNLFDDIFISESIWIEKPNLSSFHCILEKIWCNKEIIMIGDDVKNDILPALRIWINAILFSEKKISTSITSFNDYKDLPWIIQRIAN
jgi:HAD superfamily hydrolase (TIGR01549 family)